MGPLIELFVHGKNEARTSKGELIRLPTKKTFGLLVLLHENSGNFLSRRILAQQIWPSTEDKSARASLRAALSALRHVLPTGTIDSDVDQICLQTDRIQVSTTVLDGEFMPDFDDDWVIERRLKVRAEAVNLWMAKAQVLLDESKVSSALELIEKACERDPLSDEAAALRVVVLERLGRGSQADKVVQNHRARMIRELGTVSEVKVQEVSVSTPLVATAEWLLRRDPNEAVAFLASTRTYWEVAAATSALSIHLRALDGSQPNAPHRRLVEANTLYLRWCHGGITPHLDST